MAENTEEQQQQQPSSNAGLKILVLALALLVVLGGGAFAWVMLQGSAAPVDEIDVGVSSPKVGDYWPPTSKKSEGLEITGNLQSTEGAVHFKAVAQFELKFMNDSSLRQKALDEMSSLEPWIADVCRRKISTRSQSLLLNESEQDRIIEEIIQVLNQRLQTAVVRDIVFRTLITQ